MSRFHVGQRVRIARHSTGSSGLGVNPIQVPKAVGRTAVIEGTISHPNAGFAPCGDYDVSIEDQGMSKYTPGPWIAQTDPDAISSDDWVIGIEGAPIDYVATCSRRDASLIAAAPIILQELKNANSQMDMAAECIVKGRYDEAMLHVCSMGRLRVAAIAAATGEAK
jgi:hypothetical protein